MARRNLDGISIAPLSEQRLSSDGLWSAPRLGGRRADGGGAPPGIHDLFNGDPPITGTANSDFILVLNSVDATVDAGDGADIVADGVGPIRVNPGGATSFGAANDLDSNTGLWFNHENALFADGAVPHMTVYQVAEAGAAHYYKIVMAAGQTITLDIDGADEALGGADDTDTVLELFHEGDLVNTVATNDDSNATDGGYGSVGSLFGGTGTRDSYISFTATVAGTYYIVVSEYAGAETNFAGVFGGGEQYLLNVSLTGHATSASSNDGDMTVIGGAGDDLLLGAGGDDSLSGGTEADTIDGGTGGDRLDGGAGNDSLVGGSTSIYERETLFGRDDNDTLIGGAGANALDGAAGNDSIVANGSFNVIVGGAGADTIVGGAGFDVAGHSGGVAASVDLAANSFAGGDADGDVISGLEGYAGAEMNDTIAGSGDANLLGGLDGNDLVTGLGGNDTLDGGDDEDTLDGGDDNDLLSGADGLDSLIGGGGADDIFGGADNDTIAGGLGADVIFGDGPATINANPSFIRNDNIDGAIFTFLQVFSKSENPLLGNAALAAASLFVEATAGQEEYFAVHMEAGQTITIDVDYGSSTDTIVELIEFEGETVVATNDDAAASLGGLGSSSSLDSYLGFTAVTAGIYLIRVYEFGGNTTFEGGESFLLNVSLTDEFGVTITEGADSIAAGGDDDQVFGGGGNDTVNGDAGFDLIMGGSGADSLIGGGADDTLIGGEGADALNGGGGSDWADYSGSGLKVIVDLLAPANNINDAAGDSYVSIENLRGGGRADQLNGNNGANILEGGGKSDFLGGGQGDDTLIGGEGKDTLRGAAGADEFHLTNLAVDGFEKIKDFIGGDDLIVLDGAVFGLAPGALNPDNFVVASSAQDADDLFYYKTGPGTLFFDADGNGAGAAIQIATLIGAPPLSASDFFVI